MSKASEFLQRMEEMSPRIIGDMGKLKGLTAISLDRIE